MFIQLTKKIERENPTIIVNVNEILEIETFPEFTTVHLGNRKSENVKEDFETVKRLIEKASKTKILTVNDDENIYDIETCKRCVCYKAYHKNHCHHR